MLPIDRNYFFIYLVLDYAYIFTPGLKYLDDFEKDNISNFFSTSLDSNLTNPIIL